MCDPNCRELHELPEVLLSRAVKEDLGVDLSPQALRTFVRSRWGRISVLAHAIHEGEPT